MPSRRKSTSANTNNVGRSIRVRLSSSVCARQRSFDDAPKEIDDVGNATAADLEEPGRVFTPILAADAGCSTHHTTG
jgi:hypothetical protein